MSRCFPFPPPGYERKARIDDKDLLEKEKNRDKKQKKEKDKEKRESKDKRDKDRSDGKHREKKDKKEKHRDKERDKEKDRDRDRDKDKDKDKEREKDRDKVRDKKREKEETEKARDKSKAPDEKRLSGQPGPQGGDKLDQKESKEKNASVDKKFSGQAGGHKVEKLTQNTNPVEESKFVKDLGRRIKDDAMSTGNHVANFPSLDRKKDEGIHRVGPKGTSALVPPIKDKDKKAEDKPTNVHGSRDGTRPGGNAFVQNSVGTAPNKFEALPRLLDKSVERKMEGHEKPKDKEIGGKGEDVKWQEKDKEGDDKRLVAKSQEKDSKEKKSHGKDKDRNREKKKEDREKRKEDKQKKKEEKQRKKEDREKKKEEKAKTQLQIPELDKVRGSANQHDLVDNHAIKPLQPPKQSDITMAPSEPNTKKRKDLETNGVAHAHNLLPNKLLRPTPSSNPPLENGRIWEHNSQAADHSTERKKVAASSNDMKVDNEEPKINGITEVRSSLSVSPMKVKPATPAADQMAKPSVRPPHRDTKYLSQIYTVPKMDEWPDHDEQEWLFGGKASEPKNPNVDPSGSEESPIVWAEARRIESSDIVALPYVIPY